MLLVGATLASCGQPLEVPTPTPYSPTPKPLPTETLLPLPTVTKTSTATATINPDRDNDGISNDEEERIKTNPDVFNEIVPIDQVEYVDNIIPFGLNVLDTLPSDLAASFQETINKHRDYFSSIGEPRDPHVFGVLSGIIIPSEDGTWIHQDENHDYYLQVIIPIAATRGYFVGENPVRVYIADQQSVDQNLMVEDGSGVFFYPDDSRPAEGRSYSLTEFFDKFTQDGVYPQIVTLTMQNELLAHLGGREWEPRPVNGLGATTPVRIGDPDRVGYETEYHNP